jgi:hypothetical protein
VTRSVLALCSILMHASGPAIGLGVRAAIVLVMASCSGSSEPPEGTLVASFSYAPAARRGHCDNKPGAAGATNGLSSLDGTAGSVAEGDRKGFWQAVIVRLTKSLRLKTSPETYCFRDDPGSARSDAQARQEGEPTKSKHVQQH